VSIKDFSGLIFSTFILSALATFTITHYLFFFEFKDSVILGAIMASISPAVVIPLIESMNISDKLKSAIVVESTITDVISIFLVISIMYLPANQNFEVIPFIKSLFFLILKSSLIGILAAIIWSYIFIKLRAFPNTIFTSIAFILILFGISHHINASSPITVLFCSMIISMPSKSKVRIQLKKIKINIIEFLDTEKVLYGEVIFVIKTFFFVYLGIEMSSFLGSFSLFKFSFFYIQSLIVVAAIFAIRYFILILLNGNSKNNLALLAMVPKGLAAAVLISLYVSKNNIEDYDNLYFLTYGVILNSIFITSILVYFKEKKFSNADSRNHYHDSLDSGIIEKDN
jgi:NhaP-type Na+/H+ or K+/H+ antiporter